MTTDTEPIYEVDDAEYQFPYGEADEAYAVEELIYCSGCHVIPHPNPEGCPR